MSGLSGKKLLNIQGSLNTAVKWAKALEGSNAEFEKRVVALEGKFASFFGRLSWRK